jgi:CubicO group peptidase (beta-lactamase class C family)
MNQETGVRAFERYAEEIGSKYKVPGLAIGVAEEGQLSYEKAIGYRDREAELPITADTVFGVGSITKAVTAVAILQLQEKQKLSVHDPVIHYLPEFKIPNETLTNQMTIHHFLTHTSGLPPLLTLYGAVKRSMEKDPKFEEDQQQENPLDSIPAIDTYTDLMRFIAEAEPALLGTPGTEFSYSNDAYALLGSIIEQASGMPYEQYVKEYILQPASMHSSGFLYEDLNEHEDIAVLYDIRMQAGEGTVFRSNNAWDAPAMRAAGFMKSTMNDMVKFMEIIRNAGKVDGVQILSPESVELMTTLHVKYAHNSYYGYGLMIIPDFFGHKLIHHSGDIKGVTAHMQIMPELNLTGIALANLTGAPTTKLLQSAFASLHLNQLPEASHLHVEASDLSLEKLKEYEGTFASGDGMTIQAIIVDGKLQLAAPGITSEVLEPIGNDEFFITLREIPSTMRFVRDAENNIRGIDFVLRQMPKIG